MANEFRFDKPERTCDKQYADYRQYKEYLAKDFNNKCGYTDCSHFWFGGKKNFHIDHFIPWKKNFATRPDLKTSYSNLVYACSYVNILKSDDDSNNFLDPCDNDLNEHFTRDPYGQIIPNPQSTQANYMYSKLKLYLSRYRIIWMLDRLTEKIETLKSIQQGPNDKGMNAKIEGLLNDLYKHHYEYLQYLKSEM